MTQQHPITPPLELVQQWDREWREQQNAPVIGWSANLLAYVATRAAQWGADQELEACCEWINSFQNKFVHAHDLRLVRRPMPPSLKEQAKQALGRFSASAHINAGEMVADFELLRRAVEQLDD